MTYKRNWKSGGETIEKRKKYHNDQCIGKTFFLMEKKKINSSIFYFLLVELFGPSAAGSLTSEFQSSLAAACSLGSPSQCSCTTSVRNSVNFTLCCLPKIPAPPPCKKKKKKSLDPDSVIWLVKSHSSPPGPAASA